MSKMFRFVLVTALAAITFVAVPLTAYPQDGEKSQVLQIVCDGSTVTVRPNPNYIQVGQSVMFKATFKNGCDTLDVAINGPAEPIDDFQLINEDGKRSKILGPFDQAGIWDYSVEWVDKSPQVVGQIIAQLTIPSLTPYGIIVLVLLLLASTVWVIRKKRAAVSA